MTAMTVGGIDFRTATATQARDYLVGLFGAGPDSRDPARPLFNDTPPLTAPVDRSATYTVGDGEEHLILAAGTYLGESYASVSHSVIPDTWVHLCGVLRGDREIISHLRKIAYITAQWQEED